MSRQGKLTQNTALICILPKIPYGKKWMVEKLLEPFHCLTARFYGYYDTSTVGLYTENSFINGQSRRAQDFYVCFCVWCVSCVQRRTSMCFVCLRCRTAVPSCQCVVSAWPPPPSPPLPQTASQTHSAVWQLSPRQPLPRAVHRLHLLEVSSNHIMWEGLKEDNKHLGRASSTCFPDNLRDNLYILSL